MTKEKTAKLIPNAIQISTDNEKVRPKLKEMFSKICKSGHYLPVTMPMESRGKFYSPQNISGASQRHSILLNT